MDTLADPLADEHPTTVHATQSDDGALVVRVEVPQATGFDDLTDSEWSAFMGLRTRRGHLS
jgi:hypothetical protein